MSGISILLSDNRGVYIPRDFAEGFEFSEQGWKNVNQEDLNILKEGPEHEWYWETWFDVVNNAYYVDAGGKCWNLWQDGDLFAICYEKMTDDERADFFGEDVKMYA